MIGVTAYTALPRWLLFSPFSPQLLFKIPLISLIWQLNNISLLKKLYFPSEWDTVVIHASLVFH